MAKDDSFCPSLDLKTFYMANRHKDHFSNSN